MLLFQLAFPKFFSRAISDNWDFIYKKSETQSSQYLTQLFQPWKICLLSYSYIDELIIGIMNLGPGWGTRIRSPFKCVAWSSHRTKEWSKRQKNKFLLDSNLGSLLHPLPPELRREVRALNKVSQRLCKSDCSLLFNIRLRRWKFAA